MVPLVSRYREPTTLEQALAEALYLALTAPDEHGIRAATALAQELARGLDARTVELCKAHALERFELDD